MLKIFLREELLLGSLLVFASIVWLAIFLGNYNFLTVFPIGFSWVGLALIVDYLERKRTSHGIIPSRSSWSTGVFRVASVAIIWSVILDGFGVFITRLWYYPYFPIKIYLIYAPLAYFAYTLLLFGLYEFVRDSQKTPLKTLKKIRETIYQKVMKWEVIIGIVGTFFSVAYSYYFLAKNNFDLNNITEPTRVTGQGWIIFLISLVSIFLVFEYICYRQNKKTLTFDIMRGDFYPLLSIIVASLIAIITIEIINIPFQVWTFDNWPLSNLRILNLPIVPLLIWPIQFFVFLSMLRSVFPSKEVIWD